MRSFLEAQVAYAPRTVTEASRRHFVVSGSILTLDGGRRKKKGRRDGSPERKTVFEGPRLRPQALKTISRDCGS